MDYEVARRLRARFGPAIRLVALTGYGQRESRTAAASFDDFPVKPVAPEALALALEPLDGTTPGPTHAQSAGSS